MKKSSGLSPAWSFYQEKRETWAYWDDAFSDEECDHIIKLGEQYELSQAEVDSNDDSELNEHLDVRDSLIAWISPDKQFTWLYNKMSEIVITLNKNYFGFDLWGFSECLQFTKYQDCGTKFDAHVDCPYSASIRKLTVVMQLSNPTTYEGGDLEIILGKKPTKLPRKRGTVLVFPSFTLHRVSPIISGTRYSLVGWVTGKPFV